MRLPVCLAVLFLITACGDGNLFSPLIKRSDKDTAQAAFQRGDYATAISSLESYLQSHPTDMGARALLANAYLKSVGIDPIALAAKINDATSQGDQGLASIIQAMPDASADNLAKLQSAATTLQAIPPDQRTPAQNYQLAVAQGSLAVTTLKGAAADSSGNIDPSKVDTITDAQATTVLQNLSATQVALSGAGVQNGDQGAAKLGSISAAIATSAGNSDRDKLVSYLKSH